MRSTGRSRRIRITDLAQCRQWVASAPMADDLFAASRLVDRLAARGRWPPGCGRALDDVVGQDQLLGPGRPPGAGRRRPAVFGDPLGPPGTGKTTIARLIATASSKAFVPLSAVTATVKDIRDVAAGAEQRLGGHGQGTILFLDEIHRFTKSQQDALLPSVETGLVVLIGATTENPHFEVNPPLMSRSTLFRLHALDQGR